jgi:hypothetical protein
MARAFSASLVGRDRVSLVICALRCDSYAFDDNRLSVMQETIQ